MSKFGRKTKSLPDGWDYVEPTMTALENELRDKVNENHEGLRKVEANWPVHQINWQKSRYM
jgi:bud site selection protein 31